MRQRRKRDVGDEFARFEHILFLGSRTRDQIKLVQWNAPLTFCAACVDRGFERHHRYGHVRRMGGDTVLARAQNGVDAVEAVYRRATGARFALVALVIRVTKVIAASALQQIAARRGHVSQLRRGPGKQRFRKHRIALLYLGVPGKVAVAHQCTNPQAAIGGGFDAVERKAVDVNDRSRSFHVQLHQVYEGGTAGNKPRLLACNRDGRFRGFGLTILEGLHCVFSSRSGRAPHLLHGGDDVVIGPTTADVAGHRLAHIVVLPADWLFQQRYSGHDLAGSAISALVAIVLNKGRLDGVQISILCKPFDCGDLVALVHDGKTQAGVHTASIHVDSTGTALAMVATLLCAWKPEVLSQSIQQGNAWLQHEFVGLPIYFQYDRNGPRLSSGSFGLSLWSSRSGVRQRSGGDGESGSA